MRYALGWTCVASTAAFVGFVTEHPKMRAITYKTFAAHTNLRELRRDGGEKTYPWLYRISREQFGWYWNFCRSVMPSGALVYYHDWSGIEHFFVAPGTDREREHRLAQEHFNRQRTT